MVQQRLDFLYRVLILFVKYLAFINIFTIIIFWYDKFKARGWCGGWRVSETTLHLTALFGGWFGGKYAMWKFQHKIRKEEFVRRYNVIGLVSAGFFMFLARKLIGLVFS